MAADETPAEDRPDETPADALDAGPETGRARGGGADGADGGPVRRCLATGERRPQAAMVRFVVAPDGTVTPDLAGRLPGRGMWLSADARSIKTACDRKLFARAARRRVQVPDDLPGRIEQLLARRCVETLSLARRAGEAVTGFEKVRSALTAGRAAVLVEAADAAPDGRRKLAAAGRTAPGGEAPTTVALLDAAEIGEAFGRERAVHAAVAPGGLADRLAREAHRLGGFRTADPGAEAGDPSDDEG